MCSSVSNFLYFNSKLCKRLQKKVVHGKKNHNIHKKEIAWILFKWSYYAKKHIGCLHLTALLTEQN